MSAVIKAITDGSETNSNGLYLPAIERGVSASQAAIASASAYAALVGVLAGRGAVTVEEVSIALGALGSALRDHGNMDGAVLAVDLYRRAIG